MYTISIKYEYCYFLFWTMDLTYKNGPSPFVAHGYPTGYFSILCLVFDALNWFFILYGNPLIRVVFLQEHKICLESETSREFSAILQYLQCVSNGYTAVLHQTIDIDGTSLCGNGCSVLIKVWSWIPVYLRDTNVSAMTNFNLGEKCLQTIQVISKSFTSLSLSIYKYIYKL